MEKDKDIFRFEDFIDVDKLTRMKSELLKEGILTENENEFDDEEIDYSMNPYHTQEKTSDVDMDRVAEIMRQSYGDSVMNNVEDFENTIYYSGTKDADEYALEFKGYMDMISTGEMTSDDGGEPQPPAEIETHSSRPFDNDEFVEESNNSDDDEYYKLYKDKAEDFKCDIAVEGVNQSDTEVRLIVESDEWTLMFVGEIRNGQCVIPMKKLSILNEGTKGNIRLEVNADGTLFTPWEDKFVVKASKKVTVNVNERKVHKKTSNKTGVSVKINK